MNLESKPGEFQDPIPISSLDSPNSIEVMTNQPTYFKTGPALNHKKIWWKQAWLKHRKKTVEELNGKIGVESSPGKGTTFEVFLPEIINEETQA